MTAEQYVAWVERMHADPAMDARETVRALDTRTRWEYYLASKPTPSASVVVADGYVDAEFKAPPWLRWTNMIGALVEPRELGLDVGGTHMISAIWFEDDGSVRVRLKRLCQPNARV